MFYNLVSNQTYYAENINLMVALGAVAHPQKTSWLNKLVIELFTVIDPIIKPLRIFDPFSDGLMMKMMMFPCMYCQWWGDIGINIIAASTTKFHDWERTKVFYGHYPAGSSVRCW